MSEKENTCEERLKEQGQQFYNWNMRDKAVLIDELRKQFGEKVLEAVESHEGMLEKQKWAGIAEQHIKIWGDTSETIN